MQRSLFKFQIKCLKKQPHKSEFFENPRYKYEAIQLSLMQRNKLLNEENVRKSDGGPN